MQIVPESISPGWFMARHPDQRSASGLSHWAICSESSTRRWPTLIAWACMSWKAAASPCSALARATVSSASCSHCHSRATSASRAAIQPGFPLPKLHACSLFVLYLYSMCVSRPLKSSSPLIASLAGSEAER
jgi:hypothetical protein